jgi:hypothetical protein
MKKIIVLSLVCFLVASCPLAFAQTDANLQTGITKSIVDMSPKESTNKIDSLLQQSDKLNADQKQKVFDIFASIEKRMTTIDAIADDSKKIEKRAKMLTYINTNLKTVLTASQFDTYLKNTTAD